MKELYLKLEEILEESVNDADVLEEFEEWDSLSILTLISFIDKEYGVSLYVDDIKKAKTVLGLVETVKNKKR